MRAASGAFALTVIVALFVVGAAAGGGRPPISHLEYVLPDGRVDIYDIDRGNKLVGTIDLPQAIGVHGVVVSPTTGMLYVSYGGEGGTHGNGSLLAYSLLRHNLVWDRHYSTGIDSMAITRDGRRIYMPVGEFSASGLWNIINAANGSIVGSITAGLGAHNTIVGLDGRYVYLAGLDTPYLAVASTSTNRIVREIGPLKSGGRPFTINGRQTLAFTTATGFLGFQVSGIRTGKVLYTIQFPSTSYNPSTFRYHAPCHGIALSPNERWLYVIDTPNNVVHVFDVRRLPLVAPHEIAEIKLPHPPVGGWLQLSRSGRYLYVGNSGDVIDTATLSVAQFLAPLQNTADSLEVDWQKGRVIATTTRYGLGYVR
jgi:DNA-binding beta-propeller fold protein YncE